MCRWGRGVCTCAHEACQRPLGRSGAHATWVGKASCALARDPRGAPPQVTGPSRSEGARVARWSRAARLWRHRRQANIRIATSRQAYRSCSPCSGMCSCPLHSARCGLISCPAPRGRPSMKYRALESREARVSGGVKGSASCVQSHIWGPIARDKGP